MNHTAIAIIPRPQHLQPGEGYFLFDAATKFIGPPEAAEVARFFAGLLRRSTGLSLPWEELKEEVAAPSNCLILNIAAGRYECSRQLTSKRRTGSSKPRGTNSPRSEKSKPLPAASSRTTFETRILPGSASAQTRAARRKAQSPEDRGQRQTTRRRRLGKTGSRSRTRSRRRE